MNVAKDEGNKLLFYTLGGDKVQGIPRFGNRSYRNRDNSDLIVIKNLGRNDIRNEEERRQMVMVDEKHADDMAHSLLSDGKRKKMDDSYISYSRDNLECGEDGDSPRIGVYKLESDKVLKSLKKLKRKKNFLDSSPLNVLDKRFPRQNNLVHNFHEITNEDNVNPEYGNESKIMSLEGHIGLNRPDEKKIGREKGDSPGIWKRLFYYGGNDASIEDQQRQSKFQFEHKKSFDKDESRIFNSGKGESNAFNSTDSFGFQHSPFKTFGSTPTFTHMAFGGNTYGDREAFAYYRYNNNGISTNMSRTLNPKTLVRNNKLRGGIGVTMAFFKKMIGGIRNGKFYVFLGILLATMVFILMKGVGVGLWRMNDEEMYAFMVKKMYSYLKQKKGDYLCGYVSSDKCSYEELKDLYDSSLPPGYESYNAENHVNSIFDIFEQAEGVTNDGFGKFAQYSYLGSNLEKRLFCKISHVIKLWLFGNAISISLVILNAAIFCLVYYMIRKYLRQRVMARDIVEKIVKKLKDAALTDEKAIPEDYFRENFGGGDMLWKRVCDQIASISQITIKSGKYKGNQMTLWEWTSPLQ